MENKTLELFRGCALAVERAISGYDVTTRRKTVGMGADGTPTSEIDKMAEDTAISYLAENSDHGVMSEEIGIVEGKGDGIVIMDPIDGTSNALNGIPFYSISLALTNNGFSDISVGYVKNLPMGKEYYAVKRKGSYADGIRLPSLPDNPELNFSVYMGLKAHPESIRIASLARRTRSLGSASLEMCMVAEGVFHLYYIVTLDRERSLRITDIAASTLILREAGGEVYMSPWDTLDMELDVSARRDVIAVKDDSVRKVIE